MHTLEEYPRRGDDKGWVLRDYNEHSVGFVRRATHGIYCEGGYTVVDGENGPWCCASLPYFEGYRAHRRAMVDANNYHFMPWRIFSQWSRDI